MRTYTNKISLVKNNRGVWDLDPFKGCKFGTKNSIGGCYGICYANRIASYRGFDFGKVVYRDFESGKHLRGVLDKINNDQIELFGSGFFVHKPMFIRLGVMCDPSHDWGHTLKIIEKIKSSKIPKVIITKHWNGLKDSQLKKIGGLCINTSISALDTKEEINDRLYWYNRLKGYCKSVLRVNTAKFIDKNLNKVQNRLLKNENVIDNILRIPRGHRLVKEGVVVVKKKKFLGSSVYCSVNNEKTFFGFCSQCPEKCGINF